MKDKLEAAARKFSNEFGLFNKVSPSHRTNENKYKSFIAGAQWQKENVWIPVSEGIPKEQGHYFVKTVNSFPNNCDVVVAEFYDDDTVFYSVISDCPISDVIAWMPIPEFKRR